MMEGNGGDKRMSDDPSYKFQHAEIEATLKKIGGFLGEAVKPHNYGFALFLYEFGEGGGLFYIANGSRDDVMKMLGEFADKQAIEAEQERRNDNRSEGER
jgi:hypothetical protein